MSHLGAFLWGLAAGVLLGGAIVLFRVALAAPLCVPSPIDHMPASHMPMPERTTET